VHIFHICCIFAAYLQHVSAHFWHISAHSMHCTFTAFSCTFTAYLMYKIAYNCIFDLPEVNILHILYLFLHLFNFIAYALGQVSQPEPQAHPIQPGMPMAAQATPLHPSIPPDQNTLPATLAQPHQHP
jgi:hypothetical protein